MNENRQDSAGRADPSAPAGSAAMPLPDPLRRNWVWRLVQIVLQNLFVFWLRYRVRGLERLPESGGALLLINHQSTLDPLLVALAMHRPVSYIARHDLFRIPVVGWILSKTYVMPIHREAAGTEVIRESIRRLEHGFLVGIFPEGTRSDTGRLGELKPGFLALVRRVNVPLFPVGIAGAHDAFPRGAKWLRRCTVRVVIGSSISSEQVAELSPRGREQEFVGLIAEKIQDCIDQAEAWRGGGR